LIDKGVLGRSRFDRVDLAEITSPDFPGERLLACYTVARMVIPEAMHQESIRP
jgi:hypothetical protein